MLHIPENIIVAKYQLIVNSLILSLFFNVRIFSVILSKENTIPLILFIGLLIALVCNGSSLFFRYYNKIASILYLLFIATFIWVISGNKLANTYYFSIFVFAIPSMLVTNLNFTFKWFTCFSLVQGIILFLFIDVNEWLFEDSGLKMYNSYLIIPFLLLSFIGIFYFKKCLCILLLCAFNIIFYAPLFLLIGVRGTYVSIVIFIILLVLNAKIVQTHKGLVFLGGFVLLFSFLCIDFEVVINNLSRFLTENDIQIYAIDKFLMMYSHGDVSNGRSLLYENAFMGFINSPIYGNGLGVFEAKNEGLYVHNVFLEILYEGGLLLAVVLFYPFMRYFKYLFLRYKNNEHYLFLSFLFACGVSRLFFSGTLWNVTSFWMFIGFMFTPLFIQNEKKIS